MEIKLTNVTYENLKKISIKILDDGITGITGEGCKILLKVLKGTLDNKGTITYDKEKLVPKNKQELTKQISYIPSIFINNYNKRTIEEYMNYMIYYNKLNIKNPRKKIIDSLKIVDLKEEYLQRVITTLSTSEIQKFQIAVALITNPKIILIEEPYINLDIPNRNRIYRLLTQLNEKYKITIIIASNNSDLLYRYTQNIVILKDYQLLKQGPTKETYEDVEILLENDIELPDIITLTYKAKKNKDIHIDYHRDVRDLIKDIYKHI